MIFYKTNKQYYYISHTLIIILLLVVVKRQSIYLSIIIIYINIMATIKKNDKLMGMDVDSYNRLLRIQSLVNGSNRIEFIEQKTSSEEYRREHPNDGIVSCINGVATDEEMDEIFSILYKIYERSIGKDFKLEKC